MYLENIMLDERSWSPKVIYCMIQYTFDPEHHDPELCRSTYMWMFFNKYIGKHFGDFLNTVKQLYRLN